MSILFTITTYLALDNKFNEADDALNTFFKFEDTNKINKYLLINEYHEKDTSELLKKLKEKYPKLIIYQKKSNEIGQTYSLNIIIKLLKLFNFKYWIQWEEGWYVNKPFINKSIDIIDKYNLDQLQFTYLDWHDQDNKIHKDGFYLIPSRGKDYYNNASNTEKAFPKWPLFSLRPSINRVSKILQLGYFKKNEPEEKWAQKFEHNFALKFVNADGIKGTLIEDYVLRNPKHKSTWQ